MDDNFLSSSNQFFSTRQHCESLGIPLPFVAQITMGNIIYASMSKILHATTGPCVWSGRARIRASPGTARTEWEGRASARPQEPCQLRDALPCHAVAIAKADARPQKLCQLRVRDALPLCQLVTRHCCVLTSVTYLCGEMSEEKTPTRGTICVQGGHDTSPLSLFYLWPVAYHLSRLSLGSLFSLSLSFLKSLISQPSRIPLLALISHS